MLEICIYWVIQAKRAMARKKKQSKINLLPKEDFSSTTKGRVLSWILSTFRIIVIVTEVLVMLAFLSRFWLDTQNTDLNEKIKQKQAVLAASVNFENQFKDTQVRLKVFSEYSIEEGFLSEQIRIVNSRLPSDVVLDSFNVSKDGMVLDGFATNEQSIQQFIVNLYAEETITNVNLEEVTFNQDSGLLKFRISIPVNLAQKE